MTVNQFKKELGIKSFKDLKIEMFKLRGKALRSPDLLTDLELSAMAEYFRNSSEIQRVVERQTFERKPYLLEQKIAEEQARKKAFEGQHLLEEYQAKLNKLERWKKPLKYSFTVSMSITLILLVTLYIVHIAKPNSGLSFFPGMGAVVFLNLTVTISIPGFILAKKNDYLKSVIKHLEYAKINSTPIQIHEPPKYHPRPLKNGGFVVETCGYFIGFTVFTLLLKLVLVLEKNQSGSYIPDLIGLIFYYLLFLFICVIHFNYISTYSRKVGCIGIVLSLVILFYPI